MPLVLSLRVRVLIFFFLGGGRGNLEKAEMSTCFEGKIRYLILNEVISVIEKIGYQLAKMSTIRIYQSANVPRDLQEISARILM